MFRCSREEAIARETAAWAFEQYCWPRLQPEVLRNGTLVIYTAGWRPQLLTAVMRHMISVRRKGRVEFEHVFGNNPGVWKASQPDPETDRTRFRCGLYFDDDMEYDWRHDHQHLQWLRAGPGQLCFLAGVLCQLVPEAIEGGPPCVFVWCDTRGRRGEKGGGGGSGGGRICMGFVTHFELSTTQPITHNYRN